MKALLPGIDTNSLTFVFSGVPDILCLNKPVLTLSDNGDLEEVIELKRTEECVMSESGLSKKIGELFSQMYVIGIEIKSGLISI